MQIKTDKKDKAFANFVLLPAGVTVEDCKLRTINKINNG